MKYHLETLQIVRTNNVVPPADGPTNDGGKEADMVRLNVGGTVFVTTYTTLRKISDTRLFGLTTNAAEYVPALECYFFDRNPELFNSVLDYYRTGELHVAKHVCGATIRAELEFWRISPTAIADCCVSSLFKFEDDLEISNNLKRQFEESVWEYSKEEIEASKWTRTMNAIWRVLEMPGSSRLAKVYSLIYMLFVLLTCVDFILGTHPYFRTEISTPVPRDAGNVTLYEYLLGIHDNAKTAYFASTRPALVLEIGSHVFTLFFFLDLVLKYITCPVRRKFFTNWLNVIDLIIVIALLITFALSLKEEIYASKPLLWTYFGVQSLVILRLFRLFRFAKHIPGLKVVYLALRVSLKELGLLAITFLITTSLFGGLIFYAEYFSDTKLDNFPIGMWWAIVTLTTIGYGDFVPNSTAGYLIGAICGMCGLLLISMPIAVIATNFNDYYLQNKIREKQMMRRKHIFEKMRALFNGARSADTARRVDAEMSRQGTADNLVAMNGHCSTMDETRANGVKTTNPVFKRIAVKAAAKQSPTSVA